MPIEKHAPPDPTHPMQMGGGSEIASAGLAESCGPASGSFAPSVIAPSAPAAS
jgi:hypothetical protein